MAQLAPVASAAPVPRLLATLDDEIAWAAGLFEGEGSFGLRSNESVLLSSSWTDLGDRRRTRADEILDVIEKRLEAATFERECPYCGRSFRLSREVAE